MLPKAKRTLDKLRVQSRKKETQPAEGSVSHPSEVDSASEQGLSAQVPNRHGSSGKHDAPSNDKFCASRL